MAASSLDSAALLYYVLLERATNKVAQDKLMRSNWINIMIQRIESAKKVIANDSYDNLHPKVKDTLKKYCVREIMNPENPDMKEKKLFMKKEGSYVSLEVIPLTETFTVVKNAHLSTMHGGIAEMAEWLSNSSFVVSSICLATILDVCKDCQETVTKDPALQKTKIPMHTELPKKYCVTGLIDIVNMSMYGTNEKLDHLLIYQDITTKFLQLRPISSADLAESTSKELMQLFSDMGPPEYILVSSDFKYLFDQVLNWLNQIFSPEIKMSFKEKLLGEMRNYSVSSKVETALNEWLAREADSKWSVGCFIVQWELNNERGGEGTSPFEKVRRFKNNEKSEDDRISESIGGLNINRSNGNIIDDFIADNPILEIPIEFASH